MHRLVASWFGTGLILRALRGSDAGSGTVGSLFTLAVALLLRPLGWVVQVAALLVVVGAALWSCRPFAEAAVSGGDGDPGWVVIDEAAGTLLATMALTVPGAVVAWVVFRLADIFKDRFPGVAAAERLGGAIGIVADDLVAGAYGFVAGALVMMAMG